MVNAARILDRIDTTPAFVQADADRLNARFQGADTREMLQAIISDGLIGRAAAVSSFGTEAAVLLHLIAQVDAGFPIIFLETGKMFPETIAYRDTLIAQLGLKGVRNIHPDPDMLAAKDAAGERWAYDPDGCCEIRKVIPLDHALTDFDATVTGRKGFQSSTRKGLPRFEIDQGRLKVNPLADWSKADLDAYFEAHNLPRHPLEAQGYLSIGCAPCTSIVKPGENPRSGRWRGFEKIECGIHSDVSPITK